MFKVLCTEHGKCSVSSNHARPTSGHSAKDFIPERTRIQRGRSLGM